MFWLGIFIGVLMGAVLTTGAFLAAPEMLTELRENIRRNFS